MQTMNRSRHDVVVVGARVAGSATAMLLARLGHDVVVLDQTSFRRSGPRTRLVSRAQAAASRARPSTTMSESPVPPSSSRLTSESSPT